MSDNKQKKSTSTDETGRRVGAGVGGALLGASLGGPIGAIVGGLVGLFFAQVVNEQKKKND